MDLDTLPPDPLERLAGYQRARDEERERVQAALAKKPGERTEADDAAIGYSRLEGGTAAGCSCGG